MLWHSFGTIAALLQEIISIYPAINPPNLTVSQLFSALALWVKKVGAGNCNFLAESSKFPTEEIIVPTVLTVPLNFLKIGIFSSKFCIFEDYFYARCH